MRKLTLITEKRPHQNREHKEQTQINKILVKKEIIARKMKTMKKMGLMKRQRRKKTYEFGNQSFKHSKIDYYLKKN